MLSTIIGILLGFSFISSVISTNFATAPNYFGQLYATQNSPRGLFIDESGDLLSVSQRARTVDVLTEILSEDGSIEIKQSQLVDGKELGIYLNHGIVHHKGYLYASAPSAVYRWAYVPGTHEISPESPMETVIFNIPIPGHVTRTLIFDNEDNLYVSIGSNLNVDPNSERARIRRFPLPGNGSFPIDFSTGEVTTG